MAAKEKKSAATAEKKPTTRRATSTRAKAAPAAQEITDAMIAERAYHIAQSGEGASDEENWLRAEADLRGS